MLINTKTGRTHSDIDEAFRFLCLGRDCEDCLFNDIDLEDCESCGDFVRKHQETAMLLMDLEDPDDVDEAFEFDENAFKDLMCIPTGSPRLSQPNP